MIKSGILRDLGKQMNNEEQSALRSIQAYEYQQMERLEICPCKWITEDGELRDLCQLMDDNAQSVLTSIHVDDGREWITSKFIQEDGWQKIHHIEIHAGVMIEKEVH